ncbi:MAG: hypothetical protein HY920_06925 [Elusimicrobia bacterium]|nr:hypothetical protein [Elusimicrobiota bacterium]
MARKFNAGYTHCTKGMHNNYCQQSNNLFPGYLTMNRNNPQNNEPQETATGCAGQMFLTPDERLSELARLYSIGLTRLLAKKKSADKHASGDSP